MESVDRSLQTFYQNVPRYSSLCSGMVAKVRSYKFSYDYTTCSPTRMFFSLLFLVPYNPVQIYIL